jgi:hypothetical protein
MSCLPLLHAHTLHTEKRGKGVHLIINCEGNDGVPHSTSATPLPLPSTLVHPLDDPPNVAVHQATGCAPNENDVDIHLPTQPN